MTTVNYLKHEDGSYYDLDKDGIVNPLWHHKQGRQQTASGYGAKLKTATMVHYNGRLHRVYCVCYSNSGSLYIISKGQKLYIW